MYVQLYADTRSGPLHVQGSVTGTDVVCMSVLSLSTDYRQTVTVPRGIQYSIFVFRNVIDRVSKDETRVNKGGVLCTPL